MCTWVHSCIYMHSASLRAQVCISLPITSAANGGAHRRSSPSPAPGEHRASTGSAIVAVPQVQLQERIAQAAPTTDGICWATGSMQVVHRQDVCRDAEVSLPQLDAECVRHQASRLLLAAGDWCWCASWLHDIQETVKWQYFTILVFRKIEPIVEFIFSLYKRVIKTTCRMVICLTSVNLPVSVFQLILNPC